MQIDSRPNTNGAEFGRTEAPPVVNATAEASETNALSEENPIATSCVDERPMSPGAVAPTTTSNIPVPVDASTNSVICDSEGSVPKQVHMVEGISEIARSNEGYIFDWRPSFAVEEGFEGSLTKIIQRAGLVRAPLQATPAPTGSTHYGTTRQLFVRLQQAIGGQALLPEHTSALLTYWTISTWFPDGLSLAPGLVLVAPEFEGDLVLRTLRNFCRSPLLLTRVDIPTLQRVQLQNNPTLLFYDQNITKQMAAVLGCATSRGYMVGHGDKYKDFYGPKAICVREGISADRVPRCSLQVRLQPTAPASTTLHSAPPTEAALQVLQNQLMMYRLYNLVKVYNSDFDAPALTSDTRAVANALGACIVDSPGLQAQLVSLLRPVESQRQADRSTGLEAVTLEATLNLCHQGKVQILVGEIANEVNRIGQTRGERLNYSAETIGHRIKKVGLSTRRLGKAGKGLTVDLATLTRVHDLAAVYGGAGLDPDENNLHCPQCVENK